MTILNSTITQNSAPFGGTVGGVSIFLERGEAFIANSIIADQASGSDCWGPERITSLGHNLGSDGTCGFTEPSDIPNGFANLGPLQDNGGPTPTHALLAGSDAIDTGSPATPGSGEGACEPADQRGVPRPQGNACDIGAYERDGGFIGEPCDAGLGCREGLCVDGVCCDTVCDGPCERCDLVWFVGTCVVVAEGLDPDDDCPQCTTCDGAGGCTLVGVGEDPLHDCSSRPVSTCGRTGVCDGNGACALYVPGTICIEASCSPDGRTFIEEAQCDGGGTCVGETVDCFPFACAPSAPTCRTGCESDEDCASGAVCRRNGLCASLEVIPTVSAWGLVLLTLTLLVAAKLRFRYVTHR